MSNTIRNRQITYGVVILVLFSTIAWYSPILAEKQRANDLGEATVGQVDAGSFMLKLAMIGGARGIAANVLWSRAVELQRQQEWDKLKSTVDLITKLQPHFLAIWTFQGWNLAYNVSVEWDDPADKYVWIKNGIKFLEEGVDHNPKSPDLTWDTAWTYYHKLGFSDEAIVLRRQFYDDDDDAFRTDPVENTVYPDNFLVARGWFEDAIDKAKDSERLQTDFEAAMTVDMVQNRKGRPGDLSFQSMPGHAATRYAQGLEKRSIKGLAATFGERASGAWGKALTEWDKFGDVIFRSHNAIEVQGRTYAQPIRLGDSLDWKMMEERGKDPAYWERVISDFEKVDLKGVTEEEAGKLSDNEIYWTNRWSDQMNFRYWRDRSLAEMERDGVRARQLMYEATESYMQANFREAVAKFKEGLDLWREVLDRHPVYRDDELNRSDTAVIVRRYVDALKQAGMPEPEELPFAELIEGITLEDNPDPFDELEMLGPGGEEISRPQAAAAQ